MRSLTYAYPTSDQAAKHGRSKTGCYILTLAHHEYAIDCPRVAVRRFEEYPHLTINNDSFFGPLDSDKGRRQRMLDRGKLQIGIATPNWMLDSGAFAYKQHATGERNGKRR